MEFLLWALFGGIVGWVASIIMGTDSEQGMILNVVIGMIGAFIGGGLMIYFGEAGISGFNLYSFGVALVGAVVLIFAMKILRLA